MIKMTSTRATMKVITKEMKVRRARWRIGNGAVALAIEGENSTEGNKENEALSVFLYFVGFCKVVFMNMKFCTVFFSALLFVHAIPLGAQQIPASELPPTDAN